MTDAERDKAIDGLLEIARHLCGALNSAQEAMLNMHERLSRVEKWIKAEMSK
jgi:hypothetical protein